MGRTKKKEPAPATRPITTRRLSILIKHLGGFCARADVENEVERHALECRKNAIHLKHAMKAANEIADDRQGRLFT